MKAFPEFRRRVDIDKLRPDSKLREQCLGIVTQMTAMASIQNNGVHAGSANTGQGDSVGFDVLLLYVAKSKLVCWSSAC